MERTRKFFFVLKSVLTQSSQDKENLSCPFQSTDNFPEWKLALTGTDVQQLHRLDCFTFWTEVLSQDVCMSLFNNQITSLRFLLSNPIDLVESQVKNQVRPQKPQKNANRNHQYLMFSCTSCVRVNLCKVLQRVQEFF